MTAPMVPAVDAVSDEASAVQTKHRRPTLHILHALRSKRSRRIFVSLSCVVIGMVYAFPLVWVISMSVRSPSDALGMTLIPHSFYLQNFVNAWVTLDMGQLFVNTILIAMGTVILSVLLSVLAAYGFVRWRTRLTELLFLLFLFGMMIPPAGMILPFFVLARSMGLYNSLWAVIIAETAFALPLGILLMRGYIERVPTELIDAARVDGATPWRVFRYVVLPLLTPAIATSSLFILLFAWNDLLLPLILLPDPQGSTLVVGLASSTGQFGLVDLGMLGAASLLGLLPILVVFIVSRRYYVQGLAAGAVKG
jgi:ABC-type glycerol-3-phosphate transport system permease component